MKPFRTILPDLNFSGPVGYQNLVMTLGSCFAEYLSKRLELGKFSVLHNPFGSLYNPLVIARAIEYMLDHKMYSVADLIETDGLWHSFDFHGAFSGTKPQEVLAQMNGSLEAAAKWLQKTDRLVITLGSAYFWTRLEGEQMVANCHKFPARDFRRDLAAPQSIQKALIAVLGRLKRNQAGLQVLLTVSPVRHLRDGLVNNQRSKAILIQSAHEIVDQLDFVEYFPAYEILMDDLRDYRFVERDLCHPSAEAIDYVWAYAQRNILDETALIPLKRIEKIQQGLKHRPFYPNSEKHQRFLKSLQKEIKELEQSYPNISFPEERIQIENLIN